MSTEKKNPPSGDKQWNTAEVQEEFIIESFMAPYVVVTRRIDGVRGTLRFNHSPRVYYKFVEANLSGGILVEKEEPVDKK